MFEPTRLNDSSYRTYSRYWTDYSAKLFGDLEKKLGVTNGWIHRKLSLTIENANLDQEAASVATNNRNGIYGSCTCSAFIMFNTTHAHTHIEERESSQPDAQPLLQLHHLRREVNRIFKEKLGIKRFFAVFHHHKAQINVYTYTYVDAIPNLDPSVRKKVFCKNLFASKFYLYLGVEGMPVDRGKALQVRNVKKYSIAALAAIVAAGDNIKFFRKAGTDAVQPEGQPAETSSSEESDDEGLANPVQTSVGVPTIPTATSLTATLASSLLRRSPHLAIGTCQCIHMYVVLDDKFMQPRALSIACSKAQV